MIEVNGVAAWQGLQRVTRFNIARAIVDDLLDRKLALNHAGAQADTRVGALKAVPPEAPVSLPRRA